MTGWAAVAARILPAIVSVRVARIALGKTDPETGNPTTPGDRNHFVGSGFIVDPSGVIVTNKHVIGGALWITVRLEDGTEVPATAIAVSPFVDLALLKVNVGHKLPILHLGNGDAALPGDPVLAVGDPLGIGTSLSAGIVSGTQRDLMTTPFDDYVQTDAAINHGNSGGPLVDAAGDVIGVNTILVTSLPDEGSNGLGFAISSNVVDAALRHLLHPNRRPIGWIGLHLQGVTPNLAEAMELPQRREHPITGPHPVSPNQAEAVELPRPGIAIVTKVDADSPGSAAGLQPGDVILRYGDETPPNARILMRDIATTPIGATRVLEVWSDGKRREIPLAIRAWPGVAATPAAILENPNGLPPPTPDLGLLLAPISPLARRAYKLGDGPGVMVAAVDRMSEAYSRGLRPGVVIERIDSQPVTTPAAARRLLAEAARHLPMVALLARWPDGPSWITLHTGRQPEPGDGSAPGGVATGGASHSAPASAGPR